MEESDSKNNRCCFPVSRGSVALSGLGCGAGRGGRFPRVKSAIFLFKELQMKFRNDVENVYISYRALHEHGAWPSCKIEPVELLSELCS